MYLTSLPDHNDPGFDEQLHFSRFRQQNMVFDAVSSRSWCPRHVGCLSIKTVTSGEEWYGVGGRRLAVRPGQFLLLNNDQEYSCHIDTTERVRVFSVFFQKDFASSVLQDALSGEERSLDDPALSGEVPEFFQTLTDIDPFLQRLLTGLTAELKVYGYDPGIMDERLIFLLRHLIRRNASSMGQASRVIAIKPPTREEIYKRLCIARDLIHSCFMERSDLSVIGQAACLSVPQLVRQFKAVWHKTPHQYLTGVRLAHAARMLRDSGLPVQEISGLCGFENTSAFCRAFRVEYSMSPGEFRTVR
jgi:AraC-like DNA-binding protein